MSTPGVAEASTGGSGPLGVVSLVQLQPSGLIVDAPDSAPVASFYDARRRVEVDRLEVSRRGIEAMLSTGERILDIHHLDHPDKAYEDDDLVCIGFSAHYKAMRTEFGDHMVDGIAGENILVDTPGEVWPDDLGPRLGIENQETGELAILDLVSAADPCVEFSRFCARRAQEQMSGRRLGEILRFLGGGRRGYLLVLDEAPGAVTVRPGDTVFGLSADRRP